MIDFWQYIKDNVSATEWDNLTIILSCSPKRLTRLKSGKSDFSIAEVETLAKLVSRDPVDFAHQWRLGYKTSTVQEMQDLPAGTTIFLTSL